MNQETQPQTDQSDAVELLHVRPPQSIDEPALSPRNASRSRHWRFWLGLIELLTGGATGLFTLASAANLIGQVQDDSASGMPPAAGWITGIIIVFVAYTVVSLAGVIIGIWNLSTLKSTARSPLIAAIVVSTVSIVLVMVFISGPPFEPVKVAWAFVHALVSVWTIRILRLKKIP
ncbi:MULTISPECIES: hypothetical protein [Arthrobacter]|uniref:DUF2127 domain-containing protein n=1 Tax=Arthrobacter terricola TaxID=2547396 RepID=A0A4R5KEM1_9MICC|nr:MULTISPECIES: hypothetical protein [Arthrobacter]MBT8161766.1 hypothetical protein [Arthrobacter sp. GN70]TDF92667.1 hypothetical protein E1809_17600 [Arthrobacter terricola]